MVLSPGQTEAGSPNNSLKALLERIDQKTEPALQRDLEILREHSGFRGTKSRTLYISFVVGWHEMALPVTAMQALGNMPDITPLPYLPSWIKGIVQIRGEILSVVDFQQLFHLREERRTVLQPSFIFFQHDDLQFCLLVNKITGILSVDEQEDHLESCSADERAGCMEMLEFIKGVLVRDRRRIFILNSDALGHAEVIRRWR